MTHVRISDYTVGIPYAWTHGEVEVLTVVGEILDMRNDQYLSV